MKKIKRGKEKKAEKINNALNILSERERKIIELNIGWLRMGEAVGLCDAICRKLKDKTIHKMLPVVFVAENQREITVKSP